MFAASIAARGSHSHATWVRLLVLALCAALLAIDLAGPQGVRAVASVAFVSPDSGEILDGSVTIQANVSDATVSSVEFFYDPHEDDEPEFSLGMAAFNSSTGYWQLTWDTTTVPDTFNDIDTIDDGIEDTTVNLTKPPTHDGLRVQVETSDAGTLGAAIDVRIQNMLTVRFTLPDNQEDLRGFQDLEAVLTSEFDVTSVRFDAYPMSAADPRILTPFGEFDSFGEPIENAHYGRPLGDPDFPTGSPAHAIGAATLEGARRWVLRDWDTTTIPDGTWLLVATAEDAGGRRATYMVETYIVNDLRVVITAPEDSDTVSRFVALEARTSSLTGADNAAPGSLWPATSVVFGIGATNIPATEIPAGSGRWRAVWEGDTFAPGPYTITATATNANPNGPEIAMDSIGVTLVAPGPDLEALFPFDWGNCTLQVCSFLDGSGGGPTSWEWDFGDGNSSTSQNPTHTYASYGVYTVSLTVGDGTDTDTYSRVIPVGNTGVVSFNRNAIDETAGEIDWTSAFKDFEYTVGATLAIPVMWDSSLGATQFVSLPTEICDDDETSSNQECVIFTPEEAVGTAPAVVGAAEDGVLFTMEFTEVQFRGVTDVFKGKANVRVVVDVDTDSNTGNGYEAEVQLGTNVDVTNSGTTEDETRAVRITSPLEGQFVGGTAVPVKAGVVSSAAPTQVEFFLNGSSLGVDTSGADGWSVSWDTTSVANGAAQLTATATINGVDVASGTRNVTVDNAIPPTEPPAPAGTFQIGRASDTTGQFISFSAEVEEEEEDDGEGGGGGGGGKPDREPPYHASMTAEIVPGSIAVYSMGGPGTPGQPGGPGLIGGDALEFDIILTNTSTDPAAVLTAYAFQSKFSESPALASRIGDKAFYGVLVPGAHDPGPMTSVKKNGTSNGLFSGRWKGICINSSTDFLPEFNSGIQDESLECAGNRADEDFDGLPELQFPVEGIYPGQTQTVRVRIEAGTTDGALHVVEPGTLRGKVKGTPFTTGNGLTYLVPEIDNTDVTDPNVISIPDFGDNKVLRDADGTFNPTFAPLADGLTFENQQYLTLPRANFAFTDLLGRNHTCGTYGLEDITAAYGIAGDSAACDANPGASPLISLLGVGDLVPGVQNLAALLQGFGEYRATGDPDEPYVAPDEPYDALCTNPATPDGLRCGAKPYTPIAEFYKDNGDGTLTQQMVGGSYGAFGSGTEYDVIVDSDTAEDWKDEVIPELDPGAPPPGPQLGTSATGQFYDLRVVEGAGINGGDVVEFTIDITNTSRNADAYLTAFNYQTKQRNLADIGGLDGFTQDRRDIRVDDTLPLCNSLDDGQCYNASLEIGHFPNVIGNGLLFGQMVWQSGRIDRAGEEIVPDFVAVDSVDGIDPVEFGLESVKKNGPFSPILKGNTNFICVKSGLFAPDQDADAACAGEPAILLDPEGDPVPGNISQRLGLAPGVTQSVRIRQEFGDFRGAVLQVAAGTLTEDNVRSDYDSTDGLARQFDCEDQRELEYCHPHLVGEDINYLPNTDATWLTPETLEEIEWVIINQPGDAARIMDFQDNFGHILAMAGFIPSAEFYAPDPNPALVGTPDEGILIRQQVLGEYAMTDVAPTAPSITSSPTTELQEGTAYVYDVTALAFPAPSYAVDSGPVGMVIDSGSGRVSWPSPVPGTHPVTVSATNTAGDDTQTFELVVEAVAPPLLDDFNRRDGGLGSRWDLASSVGYLIKNQAGVVGLAGPGYWMGASYGANQEASLVLTNTRHGLGQQGLLLKVQGTAKKPSYATGSIRVYYQRDRGIVVATHWKSLLGKEVGRFAATVVNGDRLSARALADGSVKVFLNGELLGTANAGPNFAGIGGRIGLGYLLALSATFDDFGGRTLPS
jgi:PKD repeat protein